MSFGVVLGFDAIASNHAHLPAGQHAGYITGSGDVPWTSAMWRSDPGAIQIDQAPVNTAANELADVIDYEAGAATLADLVSWVKAAQGNFDRNARPGQRRPCIYASEGNVHDVADTLVRGGITHGVSLWIAHYGISQASAVARVLAAAGPFPVTGFQFTDQGGGGTYDVSAFSTTWLGEQSGIAGSTVAQGSSGPAVRALQQRLGVWSHPVSADGLFGPATDGALRAFQKARKLTVDGVAGPASWKALNNSPAPVAPPSGPPVTAAPPLPAPLDLRQSVTSVSASVTFSWGPVPGVSAFQLQVEQAETGALRVNEPVSGLTATRVLAGDAAYRWRVAAVQPGHAWPAWQNFTTP